MKRHERLAIEFDRNAVGYDAAHHILATDPDDARNRDRGEKVDDRIVHGVGQDRVFVRVHVAAVDFREALVGFALAVEKLQHDHAADVLLQIRINAGDGGANAAVRIAHLVAENLSRHHDEGQNREGNQRQLPVHAEHDAENSHQHKDVFKDGNHAGGEHFIQRVNVSSDARDQAADRILVVKSHVHALQVAENLATQVEHYFLPGPLHEVSLQELEHEGDAQEAEINGGNLLDPAPRLRAQPTPPTRGRALDRSQVAIHGYFH